MNQRVKLIIGVVIAIAGVALATRAVLRTSPPRSKSSAGSGMIAKEPPPPVGIRYRSLTDPEEVQRAVETAVDVALRETTIPQRIRSTQPEDLRQNVVERFQSLLTTDLDRDLAALVRRGATFDPSSLDDEGRERMMRWMGAYRGSKPDFDNLSVRMVCNRGVWISDDDMMQGYVRTMTEIQGSMAPPVPEMPSETQSDIIEVRVPMLVDAPEVGEHEVIMAFMLLWDPKSASWVPFRSMLYHAHSHVSYVAPFL